MANYLTIDGGTTNTRINLILGRKIIDTVKLNIGVRANINGNSEYKKEISKGIEILLKNNKILESDIEKIICSGMITSELGLCHLEHLEAPCGIDELSKCLHEVKIEEISSIPFVFVRGVKTKCDSIDEADIMRGEETEFIGICDKKDFGAIYVLPGSHSKIIYTDEKGRIYNFSTELSGEIIEAVANNTILKEIIDLKGSELDEEYLQLGYNFAKENGVNAAFFKVRILKNIFSCEVNELYSFFIGAALCPEIDNIIKSPVKKVIIGGKRQLRIPIELLLKNNSDKEAVCVDEDTATYAATYGMIKTYEHSLN